MPGTVYPRLAEAGLLLDVADAAAVAVLPEAQRAAIRVVITGAQRGCDATLVALLPGLRQVISMGAGLDRIDLPALALRGIALRAVGETLTDDVADLVMALTLMTMRDLRAADEFARGGAWRTARFAPRRSLVGATMGIAGLGGRIGRAVARRAVAARMHVVGLARPSAEGLGFPLLPDMRALAEASDVLALCLPGGPGLRHVVGAAELAALGADGTLINIGRGELVDTAALIEALEQRVIAAAGLDVLEGEPQVPARLAALPNVVLTPHMAGATWGARARAGIVADEEAMATLGHQASSASV